MVANGATAVLIHDGDTASGLADQFNVPFGPLQQLNPGLNFNDLEIGTAFSISTNPSNAQSFILVRSGDTLDAILQATGVNKDPVLALNTGVDFNNLQAGTLIAL